MLHDSLAPRLVRGGLGIQGLWRMGMLVMVLASAVRPVGAADPFAENVRSTPWLSPEEERRQFELLPGFEIKLFASEPDILKPMNMAFDEQGRMWVTTTREYPYAAPLDRKGLDLIKLLVDTDDDGVADRITTFADDLNIPIGLHPYRNGVIAWSIPNIWFLEDTDGDGRADRREKLFGPLGYERDTHGMNSSFRRGYDGWVYATHGFNNISTFRAADGSSITMQSGNTYRFRPDGSRVEQHTWGQVNPFGICFDSLGNLYSADCHSAPIYQLLEGGYYPSFGKPHDGLGFAPVMLQHSHGSTAICGISIYEDNLWPEAYHRNMVIGNVMTSRVNRDALSEIGSTLKATEVPDFVATKDPWFRPVDIQLGPDGALYVADFYNRIIGHYEVPLDHPGRDRTSGRIWRITYRGEDGTERVRPRRDLSRAGAEALVSAWSDPNLTYRLLALNALVDRIGPEAVPAVQSLWGNAGATPSQKVLGLWALFRLDALVPRILGSAVKDGDREVRTHVMRVLARIQPWTESHRQWALIGLQDEDAFVRRSAAEALSAHPHPANLPALLSFRRQVPPSDTHTLYVARKALRDHLLDGPNLVGLERGDLESADKAAIADVALALPHGEAAAFLVRYAEGADLPPRRVAEFLRHAARYLPAGEMDGLARLAQREFPDQVDEQLALFQAVQGGLAERGGRLEGELLAWGTSLAESLLRSVPEPDRQWTHEPAPGSADPSNPWVVQRRDSADGGKAQPFFCTLPSGEQRTGMLRSPLFPAPKSLRFFMAGHDGFPDKDRQRKNLVRLREAETGAVLQEAFAPRNDVAQEVAWDLSGWVGRPVQLELIDQDTAGAYAWLAVGRFEPAVVEVPDLDPAAVSERQRVAMDLARQLQLVSLGQEIRRLYASAGVDAGVRAAAATALAVLKPAGYGEALGAVLGMVQAPVSVREATAQAMVSLNDPAMLQQVLEVLRTAAGELQLRLAQVLAGQRAGAEALLESIEAGKAPAVVLLDRGVRDRLKAAQPPRHEERVAALTKTLAPPEEARLKLIASRIQGYLSAPGSPEQGRALFTQSCGVCHQVGGEGGLVGPQLDGIGNRGLDRVMEDVLDPNRNVDHAFRSTVFTLQDGDIVSGLFRREEGELVILADSTGKEISVNKGDIEGRFASDTSLMPDNFVDLMTPEDFNHLMSFLMAQRSVVQP